MGGYTTNINCDYEMHQETDTHKRQVATLRWTIEKRI